MPRKKEDTEAQRKIIKEWDNWARQHPDDAKVQNGMLFFGYLQKERTELLEFKTFRDKWQVVHGWLRRTGRVEK